MFTGLIQERGRLLRLIKKKNAITLTCKASPRLLKDYNIGDSMALNGVCCTCITKTHDTFTVELMPETVKRTQFAQAKSGDSINLELAMSVNQRFEGHIVTGHVDASAKLIHSEKNENAVLLSFSFPKNLLGQIVPQGSVALNGVSLTVVSVKENTFTVSLIPHTAKETNLADINVGQSINLETDILSKYIQAQFNLRGGH